MVASPGPDYTRQIIWAGRFLLDSRISNGASGVIYRAVDLYNPARPSYAVKWLGLRTLLPNGRLADRNLVYRYIDREIANHRRVSSHPNVINLHSATYDQWRDCFWLLLDWCSGGDVFASVTKHNWWWANEARSRSAVLQLIDSVAHCHSLGIYHRDIKPENVLCSSDGSQLFLADFGVSTTHSMSIEYWVGTREFLSPGRRCPFDVHMLLY
jgi:serine/threonine protein kinase